MEETPASPRRPKRGRPRQDDHHAGEDFERVAKADAVLAARRPKRKRATSTAAAHHDQPLIDIIKNDGKLISRAVKNLIEEYETKKNSVTFQILTTLFEACGATKHEIRPEQVFNESDDVDDVVFSLINTAREGHVEDNFNSKQKDLSKNFRDNLASFWDHLVLESQNGPLFDNLLFEKITDYVVALVSTPPRVYRQVASLIGLQLVTSFISVAKTLRAE